MITFTQLNSAVATYPNDQELGAFIRSLYYTEQRRQQQLLTNSLGKGET
tara:strand:- start:42 stop:188 length:147 start_codon:yes stop_codon:yes gene_type:complete